MKRNKKPGSKQSEEDVLIQVRKGKQIMGGDEMLLFNINSRCTLICNLEGNVIHYVLCRQAKESRGGVFYRNARESA